MHGENMQRLCKYRKLWKIFNAPKYSACKKKLDYLKKCVMRGKFSEYDELNEEISTLHTLSIFVKMKFGFREKRNFLEN
jgi:hypothetical protein